MNLLLHKHITALLISASRSLVHICEARNDFEIIPSLYRDKMFQNVQYFSASVHIPLEHLRSTSYSVQKAPAPIKHLLDRKVTNLRENEETQAQLS